MGGLSCVKRPSLVQFGSSLVAYALGQYTHSSPILRQDLEDDARWSVLLSAERSSVALCINPSIRANWY